MYQDTLRKRFLRDLFYCALIAVVVSLLILVGGVLIYQQQVGTPTENGVLNNLTLKNEQSYAYNKQ